MQGTIIQNLNSVILTKSELKSILREYGVNPGEVFSDYPSYFRDVIESAGGDMSYAVQLSENILND